MILSDLMRYAENLLLLQQNLPHQQFLTALAGTMHSVLDHSLLQSRGLASDPGLQKLINSAARTESQCQDLVDCLREYHAVVEDIIRNQQVHMLAASQDLYQQQFRVIPDSVLEKSDLPLTPDQHQLLVNRVWAHCHSNSPGLLIRPYYSQWIPIMAGVDQLYLFDNHRDTVMDAFGGIPDHQQGRYLPYWGHDQDPWRDLPRHQLKIILAYNFFNFKPLDVIYHYLWELSTMLRANGRVVFTFNDCDYAVNCALAEKNAQCFTPGHQIRHRAQDLGFTVEDHQHFDNGVSWMVLHWNQPKWQPLKGGPFLTKTHAR
jgi:hypothetical protein